MTLLRTTLLLAILAFVMSLSPLAAQNVHTQDMDRSVKPGDDFYRFANGGWLKVTSDSRRPAELWHQRHVDRKRQASGARSHSRSGRVGAAKGTIAQKVGDYYAAFMDEEAHRGQGLKPLADEMATISAISNKTSLSAYLGTTLNSEVDGLTNNADHIFGVWVNQGFDDSKHYVFHLLQGGLGMPDRDSYLDPSPKMAALRAQLSGAHCGHPETGRNCRLRKQSGANFGA